MRPVSDTKWVRVHTPGGDELVFVARPELRDRSKSAVVLIHDLFASPGALASWYARLEPEAEVVLAALPGHGVAPKFTEGGWDNLVAAYAQSLSVMLPGRRVLVVGLGLGGALALALNAYGYASIAVDPILSTAKLWPIEAAIRQAIASGQDLDPAFLFDLVGWRDDAIVEDRSYGDLLDRLKAPVLVLTGDQALGEARPLPSAPALLTEADFDLLAGYPDVRVRMVQDCGHDVLGQAAGLCREIILDELARA